MTLTFTFSRRRLMTLLITLALVLSLASWAGLLVRTFTPYTTLRGTILLFDLGNEANIPTFFSSFFLLIAAGLLALITAAKFQEADKHRWAWAGLAAVFSLLAVDEIAQIHEWTGNIVRLFGKPSGIFSYAWVVCGLGFVILCGMSFARLLLSLPRFVAFQFICAAVVYLGGALGLEIIEGLHDRAYGHDLMYDIFVNTEESFEMGGTLIFIFALCGYLSRTVTQVEVAVPAAPQRPTTGTEAK